MKHRRCTYLLLFALVLEPQRDDVDVIGLLPIDTAGLDGLSQVLVDAVGGLVVHHRVPKGATTQLQMGVDRGRPECFC